MPVCRVSGMLPAPGCKSVPLVDADRQRQLQVIGLHRVLRPWQRAAANVRRAQRSRVGRSRARGAGGNHRAIHFACLRRRRNRHRRWRPLHSRNVRKRVRRSTRVRYDVCPGGQMRTAKLTVKIVTMVVMSLLASCVWLPERRKRRRPRARGRCGPGPNDADDQRLDGRGRHPREVHAGRRAGVAAAHLDKRAGQHAELGAADARSGRGAERHHRRSAALARVEHSGNRDRLARTRAGGSPLPDGSLQVSASPGNVYRGPGAPATGPKHHYTIEIFALDTKLDVPLPPPGRKRARTW